MKAWHFTGDKLRDGSPLPKRGRWLTYSGEVKMCVSGLHASLEPFDALQYAPGARLHLVELADVVGQQSDKIVARKRKIIASIDATELLRYFARMQAVSCLDAWTANSLDAVLDYLMTGDPELRSATESAAWSATESAAWSAARSAAWSAARAEFNALVYEAFAEYL